MKRDPALVAAGMNRLQSLPTAYQRVNQAVNDPNASAGDIANELSKDQAMAAQVLKVANSALYAFPSRITQISRAVTVIGTRQILNLALATSVIQMFSGIDANWVTIRSFWKHAFAHACTARELALRRREHNPEQHFVAGLLASVGRLALFADYPDEAAEAFARHHKGMLLHDAEHECYGFSQADLGSALMERWKLPKSLFEAVRYQYGQVNKARQPLEPAVTHCALFVVQAVEIGDNGDRLVLPLDDQAWRLAGASMDALETLVSTVEEQADDLVSLIAEDAA